MAKPSDFYRRQIAEAEARMYAASQAGDFAAFEAAERDKAAYESMLVRNGSLDCATEPVRSAK